jgi:hypothetical protein
MGFDCSGFDCSGLGIRTGICGRAVALESADPVVASGIVRRGPGSGERVNVREEAVPGLDPAGRGFDIEVLKAEPISLRVSDLALTVIHGAIAGTWLVGERGGLETLSFAALILFSSTIVLSSLMASSTVSFLERRKLPRDERPPLSLRLCLDRVVCDRARVTV